MRVLFTAVLLFSAPALAQTTDCYWNAGHMICNQTAQPQTSGSQSNGSWMQMLNNGPKPSEIGQSATDSYSRGKRQAQCDKAIKDNNVEMAKVLCQ